MSQLPTEYQSFIHLSRYARWRYEDDRRESWDETVSRYFNFFKEDLKEKHNYDLPDDTRKSLAESILNLDVMPSMRCMMTAGDALKKENVAGYNCSYIKCDNPRTFDEIMYVLMSGTGVPLTEDMYPEMHALLRLPLFDFPIQTLWMILFAILFAILLNRTKFGAHVFLVGDNPVSARLMGINVVRVKILSFVLVGVVSVFAGLLTSFYGFYFWPTTGDGFLLNTIASVFLGGTSVFGGTGSILGSFVASYIVGAINAGIVSAGINAFYTQLCFGLVIIISVVLQTIIDRKVRKQSITSN